MGNVPGISSILNRGMGGGGIQEMAGKRGRRTQWPEPSRVSFVFNRFWYSITNCLLSFLRDAMCSHCLASSLIFSLLRARISLSRCKKGTPLCFCSFFRNGFWEIYGVSLGTAVTRFSDVFSFCPEFGGLRRPKHPTADQSPQKAPQFPRQFPG